MERRKETRPRERHGLATSVEYHVWNTMLQRTTNPKHEKYKWYGGRGIIVCERWQHSFLAFLEDMGKRPSKKHQIERLENNGNYSPENCVWATKKKQANNTRSNHYLTFNGESHTITEWEEKLGFPPRLIKNRMRNCGWTIEQALTTPYPVPHAMRKKGKTIHDV